MKFLVRAICIALLFVSQADAKEEYLTAKEFMTMQEIRIRLIPADECVQRLEDFLFPKATIRHGLETLALVSRQSPFAREEQLSCLAYAVGEGTEEMAEVQLPNMWGAWGGFGMGVFGSQSQYDPEKMTKLQALLTKMQCFNKSETGTEAFDTYQSKYEALCSGKWLTKSEFETLKFEYEGLQKEFNEWSQTMMEKNFLLTSIPSLLQFSTPQPDLSHWTDLQQKLLCYKGEEGKSNPFMGFQVDPAQCGETSLSKEEYGAALQDFEKENAKLIDWQQKSATEQQRWQEFLADYFQKTKVDILSLKAPITNLSCYKAQSAANQAFGMSFHAMGPCQGKTVEKSEAESSKEKLVQALPDLQKKFQDWSKQYEKRKAEKEAEARKLIEKKYSRYGDTRLLARFHGYLKAGGAPEKLNEFCRDYEILQKRDKKFADAGFGFQVFTSPQDWAYAQNYGITEGELSAIRAYTGSFYTQINPVLWSGKELDEKLKLYKETMDGGMSRLPAYKESALIRFATLPPKILEEHQVGSIVTYQAYTSTSKKVDWQWAGNHRFLIFAASKGKKVSDLSFFPAEEEILFQAGTRFKVLSRKENPEKPGFIDFVLAEVDESGHVIAAVPEL